MTTSVGGQDGGCACPLGEYFLKLERAGVALDVASSAGFGWLREQVLGQDQKRPAPDEIEKMKALLEVELAGPWASPAASVRARLVRPDRRARGAGARAASPGVASTSSHVRDEGARVIESFREVAEIAAGPACPATSAT